MALYLLDTDCVIDYLVGVPATVALVRSLHQGGHSLATCDVVVAEVYSGLRPAVRDRAEALLLALDYLPTPFAAARQAGDRRYEYARRGIVLATSDVLVAATARLHGAIVVTGNVGHYPMVESGDLAVMPLPR
jgi:hypothetical protein